MEIRFSELKFNARQRIFSQGLRFILINAAFFAVLYVMQYLYTRLSGYDVYANEYMLALQEYMQTGSASALENVALPEVTLFAGILMLLINIMQSVLNVGYAGYCLDHSRNAPAGFKDIFNGFNYILRIIAINILIYLITLLYMLPGLIIVIASCVALISGSILLFSVGLVLGAVYVVAAAARVSLRYSVVFYVMFDNPDMSAMECLRESKEIMRGRLAQRLALDLSFIAWYFLNGFLSAFFIPVLSIWINPYQGITMANYYNRITGFSVPAANPAPGNDPFDN